MTATSFPKFQGPSGNSYQAVQWEGEDSRPKLTAMAAKGAGTILWPSRGTGTLSSPYGTVTFRQGDWLCLNEDAKHVFAVRQGQFQEHYFKAEAPKPAEDPKKPRSAPVGQKLGDPEE